MNLLIDADSFTIAIANSKCHFFNGFSHSAMDELDVADSCHNYSQCLLCRSSIPFESIFCTLQLAEKIAHKGKKKVGMVIKIAHKVERVPHVHLRQVHSRMYTCAYTRAH